MNDQLEEEAGMIAAASAVLGAITIFLKYYERKIAETEIEMSQIPRQPCVNRDNDRENYINSVLLCGDRHCINQIRMSPMAFFRLCEALEGKELLASTVNMSVKEQVLMFLHLIGHNVRFRAIGGRFFRSTWSIHTYFHAVLQAILKLYPEFVNPPNSSTPLKIINNSRFYPWFEDCIGALDGTHVRASIPVGEQDRYRNRKGGLSQNVLAAISFDDLKFTYVLAGWEASAHDSRVLNDALARGFRVPEGKYFLLDYGYALRKGFLPPYKKVRYQLKEFDENSPPTNARELFNLCHSSWRITVERAFGVLKKRFRVLDAEPFWDFQTQVDVILVCCELHNFLRGVDPNDQIMREVDLEFASNTQRQRMSQREEREENQAWKTKRDAIANAISKKFNVKCLPEHIDNHLKTVKNAWVVISKLRGKDSGFGWDDNLKMITASPIVYSTYTEANATHEKYLNKKIDMYDEIAVVVGKDVARGCGAKSFDDVEVHSHRTTTNLEEKGDDDSDFMKDNDKQSISSVSLESRKSRKRTRDDGLELQNISTQVGEVALALQKLSKSKLDVDVLYQEVMRTEGFEEEFLGGAFDYLIERENLAKGFLAKSEKLRRIWLEKFKENN